MADISKLKLPNIATEYDLISKTGRGIIRCSTDSSSTATAFVVTVSGITALYDGIILCVKNTKIASAANCTLNLNGLGAKRIWLSQSNSYCTTHWGLNQTYLFVYDYTNERWELQQGRDTDSNTDTKVRQTLSTSNTNYPLLMSYADSSNTTANIDNVSYRANAIYANPSTGNIQATKLNGVDIGNSPKFTDTTYTFATGDSNGQIKVTPSGGTAQNVDVKGLGNSAYTGYDTTVTSGSSNLVTSGAVATAIDNLPEPMIFKGTLGTGGTITTLPTAAASNEGYTYKVITAGTYASQSAKVGDVFVSAKPEGASAYSWILIPAGDEITSDTWRAIKVNGTQLLGSAISTGDVNFKNGSNVTITGSGNDITIAATDNNTTYTFANGTNGFTVTPSGGTAQTVTVTPSITNNVTGSGTTGSLAKFTGANTVGNASASADSATTGISIANHSTTSITGVQATTTTASKVTLGTAISVPNVTDVGSASTWAFENVTVPKAASSATSIPNVTAAGSGSFTATVTNGVLSFSHVHTAPTLGTAISVTGVSGSTTASHVTSGGNGTAPTLGTAISVPNVTDVSSVTVPVKNTSATTVVTGKTHTVTDNGHTHTVSVS